MFSTVFWFVATPLIINFLKFFGFFTVVQERTAQVFILFGNVELVLTEPGFYFLWPHLTWKALIVNWLGEKREVDLRLDQAYQRSLAVNSEEGAPMGIGVWYEMFITDPLSFLFKNEDPIGSLAANVSNSTVRSLSNMPLGQMLIDRHDMSRIVREEVVKESGDWGFKLGSVYIRKVHFRDPEMIRQIESKVVNRLRQVTSAIKQDGANQVNIITSSAQKTAATEFAKAAAMRPLIVGNALRDIARDKQVSDCLFDVLEIQNILSSNANIILIPKGQVLMPQLLAAVPDGKGK
ncbi:MAG: band 7 protein [Proteobacteria bacterium SG_bin7]|nr:MAG: band 7 protein [Proteobacteria bacterium SG_bin7]